MTCIPLSCFGLGCECGSCAVTFCGGGTMDCGTCEGGATCIANRCVTSTDRVPALHRATATPACPAQRGPGFLPACNLGDAWAPPCLHDSDCSGGTNGRCVHPDLTNLACSVVCSYDECSIDTDCPAHEPCECRGSATDRAANICLSGSGCRVDADCGAGGHLGYCSPSAGYGAFGCGIAYFCHTKADTCVNDGECNAGTCQYDSTAGYWHCGGPACSPPA